MNFLVPACRGRRPGGAVRPLPELPERPVAADPDGPGTPAPAAEPRFLHDAVRRVPA
ncbi:hypothetical protein [Streptomyces misionensis]|uniref:hypothetical protein n=1 Tax=Streptomyces misionensis TaxID=67331 RepID=UPI0016459A4F|nr:hypothetical protein [Streptomyces misionensis]